MPHAKEHPYACHHIVPHFAGETGASVFIVDWLDRMGSEEARLLASDTSVGMAYRARTRGQDLHDSGVVFAGDGRGRCLVHHAELPSYDPVPVGVIS